MGLLDTLYKYGEPALGLLSGAAAEPIAGWAGLLGGGANAVQNTRNALTYQPRTQQGQQGQSALAQALMGIKQTMVDNNPPVNAMVNGYNALTDKAGAYSPTLGAAMQTLPTAAAMFVGPGGSQVRSAFGNIARDGAANAMAGPAMRGPMTAQQGAIQWHGSPHQFDAFDAGKIGTGEGAQAYGHGLYLADSPDVARSYLRVDQMKPGVAPDFPMLDGQKLPLTTNKTPEHIAAESIWSNNGAALAESELRQKVKSVASYGDLGAEQLPGLQKALDLVRDPQFITRANAGRASLYKVDLPDEHIAKMLDWDKPMNQQPHLSSASGLVNNSLQDIDSQIQSIVAASKGSSPSPEAIKQVNDLQWKRTMLNNANNGTGADLYNSLARITGGQGQASQHLLDQGIPGIRYLDGGSRSAADGTRNTVVFPGNEHLLQILERNGLPIGGQ